MCHERIEKGKKNVHKYNTTILMNVSHHHTEKVVYEHKNIFSINCH